MTPALRKDIEVSQMWKFDGWSAYVAPAGVAVLLLVMIYLLHNWIVGRRDRSLMRERVLERERIARELHDTFFSSIHGMLLQLDVLSIGPGLSDHHRGQLLSLKEEMRRTMIEGRNAIHALRREESDHVDLVEELKAIGSAASASQRTSYTVHFEGRPRPLRPEVRDEVVAIAREGIINAFTHAGAGWVLVAVQYSSKFFAVEVTDNGIGIAEETLQARQREGHWGIAGMQERAARLGGQLSIGTANPHGTRVELVLAKHAAYESGQPSKALMAASRVLGVEAW